jgi:putative PIN family toxin of toxin-antitoxin system
VLDTNVIVSALVWGGLPHRLLDAATAGEIELVSSPVLLVELRDVLGREHLASRLVQQRSNVELAIALYSELAISVSPLDDSAANDAGLGLWSLKEHVTPVAVPRATLRHVSSAARRPR